MKAFFSKIWTWILAHKIITIVVASVLVVGTTCAIVLPIALHEHSYATEWSSDAENHWHDATCKHEEEKIDLAAHTYTNACDTACNVCGATRTITHDYAETLTEGETTHWYACSVCGDKKDEAAHVFDKTVASSEYLKDAASATTKAQYYKSCVCGAKSDTEYFETDKTAGTLANIQDLSKTYDKVELANPTYDTNSDGAVTVEWYQCDTKLDAKPVNAGTYKVKVIIAESATYTGISAEKEFTIAKKVLTNISVGDATYKGTTNFSFVLSAYHGLVSGENFTLQVTTASKNVGNAVEITSISYTNNNYSIDKSAITLNIVPKVLNNVTYKFTYNGSDYQQVVLTNADHSGIFGSDQVTLEVCFENACVGSAVDTSSPEMAPAFNDDNYTLGNYELSIVPKALTGSIFFDIYYGDTTKVVGRELYYYDYEITEEEYGVVNGDSVTLRALYESPNAGTADTICGLYEENNYVMGDLNVNNTVISVKTIELPEKQYIAEYTGSNKLMLDLSEYAEYGETLEMFFMAMAGNPSMPVSAVGEYTNHVSFSKINYSDTTNYEIKLPENYSLKIAPKKITNLDLKITEVTYDNGKITLIAKDGIVSGEVVTVTITNYSSVSVGEVIELVISESLLGPGKELIEFETATNHYQFAPDENDIVGKLTIVANCDVQYDGSCNCGTSHLTETLTFTGGEDVGKSATIACDSTYEGGIYKIALEGGQYEFLGSDQFFNISGIYDVNGNKLAASIGTHILPKGTYYFHVYVGSSPSSDTIWVKKTAKILDADTMANAIVPDMEPGNSDAGVRIHNLQTHNGGDTFVLFYNVGENINALGQSIYFRYEDGDGGYSATSNIESIEFYDVNGIQLNVTYDEPDMLAASGVTAVGGVYIVVTMNGEGMDNLYFYAV